MKIRRKIEGYLHDRAREFPIVTLTGCRQSGKTTLLRTLFPEKPYVNLEQPDLREFARDDPKAFLEQHPGGVILDEVQRVPELFSWIQVLSDADPLPGRFLLSGSQNFLLMDKLSQSLAGRSLVVHLLPFSLQELRESGRMPKTVDEAIFQGGYPRILAEGIAPGDWLPSYIQSYLERDVRQLSQIADLELFQRMLGLCAGRVGQLVNHSSLAGEVGVSDKTVRQWIGILKASHVVFELPPWHRNFGKRLTKSSKLYFCDTGLACSLLRIRSVRELSTHPLRGQLFENLAVLECLKQRFQSGRPSDLHFWRDHAGHEVDLLMGPEHAATAIEIKSASVVASSMFSGLEWFSATAQGTVAERLLVYGGDAAQTRTAGRVVPWNGIEMG